MARTATKKQRAAAPAKDPAANDNAINLPAHKKRAAKAWSDRAAWDTLYSEAYEFAIPMRRPSSRIGKGATNNERLFDSTAIESSFRAAGQLHADLFPPDFGKLAPGAVAKVSLNPAALANLKKELANTR